MKIFSEDGMGKAVEIPADMTARDLCQLLVYKSHCVDDNSWALVEHHPLLGLGKWQNPAGQNTVHIDTKAHMNTHEKALTCPHRNSFEWAKTCNTITDIHRCIHIYECMHACMPAYLGRCIFSRRHVFKHECMRILYSICTHRTITSSDQIKYNAVAVEKVAVAVQYYADETEQCYLVKN